MASYSNESSSIDQFIDSSRFCLLSTSFYTDSTKIVSFVIFRSSFNECVVTNTKEHEKYINLFLPRIRFRVIIVLTDLNNRVICFTKSIGNCIVIRIIVKPSTRSV